MYTSIFLTGKEVAEILNISKALAYRLIAEGKIRSIRFGRTVRVQREALDEFIQKSTSPKTNFIENNNNLSER